MSGTHAVLPTREVRRLVILAKRGDQEALDRVVHANWRLIVAVARRYELSAGSLTMDDLIQEGVIGLLRAVKLYKPARGTAFSTYAVPWIRNAIRRAVHGQGRMIRLPSYVHQLQYRHRRDVQARRSRGQGAVEAGRGANAHIGPRSSRTLAIVPPEPTSLDLEIASRESRNSRTLGELIPDRSGLTADQAAERSEVWRMLDRLPPRLAVILRLWAVDGLNFREIAKRVGLSHQRVLQLHNRALGLLRESYGLTV